MPRNRPCHIAPNRLPADGQVDRAIDLAQLDARLILAAGFRERQKTPGGRIHVASSVRQAAIVFSSARIRACRSLQRDAISPGSAAFAGMLNGSASRSDFFRPGNWG